LITKISCTNLDEQCLRERVNVGEVVNNNLPDNFFKLVVKKPWGHEYVAFQDENVAIWKLFIKFEEETSMHCHPSKESAIIVLSGQAKCFALGKEILLNPFDIVWIEKGAFHSTRALSYKGINILEMNAPPLLTDLVRLNDKYGRTGEPYESKENMERRSLEESQGYLNITTIENVPKFNPYNIVIVLSEIFSNGNRLKPGETLYVRDFCQYELQKLSHKIIVIGG